MKQRGRRSAAGNVVSIAAIGLNPTLTAVRPLTKAERDVFNLVVKEHRHLRSIDAPLLTCYSAAVAKALITRNASDFQKYSRTAMEIATKLRLTPQSGMQPVQLGRRYAAQAPSGEKKPWDKDDAKDDDE